MGEVTNIKSNKMKKIEGKVGSPEEIIERITASEYDPKQGKGSAWAILMISPESSESEVTKHYRKLSILIHPDKCKHEKASEAFQVLAKAYADTKDPAYQDKYADIHGPAKAAVRKARAKENEERAKTNEDPLETEGNEFDQEVLRECERMLSGATERAQYTNSVMEANMKRHEAMITEAKKAKREELKEKRGWEKQRDKRVAGWQVFMGNVESKRFKTDCIVGKVGAADTHHHREQRTEKQKDEAAKAGVDGDDKKIAHSAGQAGQTGVDRNYMKAWR